MKHTPGPWKNHGPVIYSKVKNKHDPDTYFHICTVNTNRLDFVPAEAKANIDLIAAAPELLAALEGMIYAAGGVHWHDEGQLDRAVEVAKAARGES